ncbi:hypothetical protein [Streptomyces sp. NRRL B-1347]|uniref:hypothetical protein n=1 Tax=Streptomyces sp. NRRL B-1347 TaxID=1476877 RepID=UPI00131E989B|nr:hypothetical protein [Streptomyces sp. NRRL B-1347]
MSGGRVGAGGLDGAGGRAETGGAGGPSSAGPTRALPAAYAVASLGGRSGTAGAAGAAGADRLPRESTVGFAVKAPPGGRSPVGGPTWSSRSARSSRDSGVGPGAGTDGPPPASWPTVPDADANRSSRESAAAAGPVSSFASSYNCAHQSAS